MKPVTLWHFWKGDEGLVFNHLEDGHSEAEKPTPKFESQNGWNGYRWEKEHAYLDDDNKVIDKETALVRAALLLRKAREKELMGTYRQKRSGLIVDVVEVRPVWNQYQNQYINMVHYVSRRGASVNKAAESWFLEAYVKET